MPPVNVGIPDPELKNSPILEPIPDEEPPPVVDETGFVGCYFNDERFDHGAYVQSGDQLLRCEHGIWIVVQPDAL